WLRTALLRGLLMLLITAWIRSSSNWNRGLSELAFWDILFKRSETEASTIRRHQDKNLKPRRIKSTSASMEG
ncbi:hypothetical protein ISN45_Aa02g000900, partial [Arabidopsis thaliana x Arabidopsis arenosa]